MARKAKPKYEAVGVEAVEHRGETRVNIPTAELADFVVKEEQTPYAVRYPRDPSLDPQLVWKGKDEQDGQDLEVPAVPVYIQEHIQPKAIIEDLRREQREGAERQASLFEVFDGMELGERVEFYQHPQNWTNRMILGDSLLAMTSLAEKEGLKGKVQMIYLDPPYGIRFGSNWQVSTRRRDVRDGRAEDATREPEQIRAFRDTWKLGIHSYLSYLRDRLVVARELLTETGSIFVQIGDENVHLVRCLLDEVFGSENFVATISFRKKTMPLGAKFLEQMDDYLMWYSKDREVAQAKYRRLYLRQDVSGDFHWNGYELVDGTRRRITRAQIEAGEEVPSGARVFRLVSMWPPTFSANAVFPVAFRGSDWRPPNGQCWPTNPTGMGRLVAANRLEPEGRYLRYVLHLEDYDLVKLTTNWQDTIGAREQKYVVETSPEIVERCILMTTDPGDLVLDPTCGSGTTAYVAEQWGRRWITIDTSRVALALARTRLMAARFPYYLLADSEEGRRKEAEVVAASRSEGDRGSEGDRRSPLQGSASQATEGDVRKGFVYRRVPHVTLKSIANNPDIREGMTRAEIEAAIARHAEQETLYDQPYENGKVVRVTGPFTVESLSPHRVLAPASPGAGLEEERPASEREGQRADAKGQFALMVLEHLRAAGVQNTVKQERLRFERLETYAGEWLQGEGEYVEGTHPLAPSPNAGRGGSPEPAEGVRRRVAVCIGPEHGTVGAELVKEAAKEAVRGVGFDLLVVCGFAFDPHVAEEAKRYGKLAVVTARINPDLQFGGEFLKKTGAGNLFMAFGEPDMGGTPPPPSPNAGRGGDPGAQIVVEIRGVDVYDPTTGQIRSHSTEDIACWFIDTEYNEECFFVRHAYFCGGGEPYERLKRALRAEIDEAGWASLYATRSRPFGVPKTGKIAVKVINHYEDEVLRVYAVPSP